MGNRVHKSQVLANFSRSRDNHHLRKNIRQLTDEGEYVETARSHISNR